MEQRSTFVTVVGWVFLVFSGIGLLEGIMFTLLPFDKLTAAMPQQPGAPQVDPALMSHFMRGVGVFMTLVTLWVVLSCIGLIRRKNWARISFMVLMVISIGFCLLYLLFGVLGALMMPAQIPNAQPGMAGFMRSMLVFMTILCGAFAALYGWILYKLNTERIRKEFEPPAAAGQATP